MAAAPTCKPYRGTLFRIASVAGGIATLFIFATNASAARHQANAPHVRVWGVALDGRQPDEPNLNLLDQAKASGVNAVVTDPKRWSPARYRRLTEMARQLGLLLIEPRRPSQGSSDIRAQRARCRAQRLSHHPCALVATTPGEAVRLARRRERRLRRRATQLSDRTSTLEYDALYAHADNRRSDRRRHAEARCELGRRRRCGGEEPAAGRSQQDFPAPQQPTAIRDYFGLLDKYHVSEPAFEHRRRQWKGERSRPAATDYAARRDRNQCDVHERRPGLDRVDRQRPRGRLRHLPQRIARGLDCRDVLHAEGSWLRNELHVLDRRLRQARKPIPEGDDHRIDWRLPIASSPYVRRHDTTLRTWRADDQRGVEDEHDAWLEPFARQRRGGRIRGVQGWCRRRNDELDLVPSRHLLCGSSHTLAVKAYDAAGNRSQAATITAVTAPCATSTTTASTPRRQALRAPSMQPRPPSTRSRSAGLPPPTTLASPAIPPTATAPRPEPRTPPRSPSRAWPAVRRTPRGGCLRRCRQPLSASSISATTCACPARLRHPADRAAWSHATGATTTSVSVSWTASTDNTGVAGYSVYNGGATAGSTTTSYTVSSLSTAVVHARRRRLRRSRQPIHPASARPTSAARHRPAPDANPDDPRWPARDRCDRDSIAVAWTASTDNVGVTGTGSTGVAHRPARPPRRARRSAASPAAPATRSQSTPTTPPATARPRRR